MSGGYIDQHVGRVVDRGNRCEQGKCDAAIDAVRWRKEAEHHQRRGDDLLRRLTDMRAERDETVALYEAAMNYFSDDEWRAFEESDLFPGSTSQGDTDA